MVGTTPDGRRLELYVRSLTPDDGPTTEHAMRVRDLAASDRYDEAQITVWGSEVDLSAANIQTPGGKCVRDRIASFRSWATDRGLTMRPFFEPRTAPAPVTGEVHATLGLPVSCLAEYEESELVHVAPYYDGTVSWTVADRLAHLEAACGEAPANEDARTVTS